MTDRGVPPRRSPRNRKPRKPLARSKKRIPRYAELPRPTKRIKARKADPAKRRFAKHRCKPFTEWLKEQRCCVTRCVTGDYVRVRDATDWQCVIVDPAHLIPRGRGAPDLNNCVSLARHLHESQEKRTDAFNAEHGVNLWEIAKQQTAEWLDTAEGQQWQQEHPA